MRSGYLLTWDFFELKFIRLVLHLVRDKSDRIRNVFIKEEIAKNDMHIVEDFVFVDVVQEEFLLCLYGSHFGFMLNRVCYGCCLVANMQHLFSQCYRQLYP